jgi:cell wall-associated protease
VAIRIVPDGDERDKDLANAIRYAVDNGAKIINMSFGKKYSPDKGLVDEAVKYAVKKDVLIIHAAGNDAKDLDEPENTFFPNKYYLDKKGTANAWIDVGASGWKNDHTLVAPFSNYGKTTVDVFAPGVHIYSTLPGKRYGFEEGTSMAAPVVSGIAALIRSYYPKLTAVQVKDIIMKTVIKTPHLRNKCVTEGIVNAYNALELASKMSTQKTGK